MISVIIPTKNRSEHLKKVLPSYLSQSHLLEIILVDDSTEERHRSEILKFVHDVPQIFLIQDGQPSGLPAARNKGIRRAKGEFIFFGEDDLELAPDHFAILVSHLKERGAHIIEGRKIWKEKGESNEDALLRVGLIEGPLWNPMFIQFYPERCPLEDTPTPLLLSHFLVRREVFAKILFEENYEGFRRGFPWHEETDFLMRAGACGFKIFFCPHALSFQFPTEGGGIHELSFWRKEYWILRNHLFLLRRHRSFIRQHLHNPWSWPLLLGAYGLRRIGANFWSQLYYLKRRFFRSS